jgi:hypothetical protein
MSLFTSASIIASLRLWYRLPDAIELRGVGLQCWGLRLCTGHGSHRISRLPAALEELASNVTQGLHH